MATPAQVDVWVVVDNDGERLFARTVASDQAGLEALLDRAARRGTPVA